MALACSLWRLAVVIPQLHPQMWENVAGAMRFRVRVMGRL